MPKFKFEYEATVPTTVRGQLSLFKSRSTVAHVVTLLAAGIGWLVGYLLMGGGTLLALAAGSAVCGLVLGVAFTRALGGPVMNLLMNVGWPLVLGGSVAVLGPISIQQLYDYSVAMVLIFPGFFITLGCMIAWMVVLGPDRIDSWSHQHLPDAFFENSSHSTEGR